MSNERFGISLNLKRIAPVQIRNFSFNSMCVFNGAPIAASDEGIFTLESADDDNGTDINAVMELAMTDCGYLGAKRFRKAYVGYETSGSIKVTAKTNEGSEKPYTLTSSDTSQKQHRDELPMTRDMKGTYWTFKIENINGCDFSIDNIEGLPILLTKGRR